MPKNWRSLHCAQQQQQSFNSLFSFYLLVLLLLLFLFAEPWLEPVADYEIAKRVAHYERAHYVCLPHDDVAKQRKRPAKKSRMKCEHQQQAEQEQQQQQQQRSLTTRRRCGEAAINDDVYSSTHRQGVLPAGIVSGSHWPVPRRRRSALGLLAEEEITQPPAAARAAILPLSVIDRACS